MADAGHELPNALDRVQRELLGDRTPMGRREVSANAGISVGEARRFWHALGFPAAREDDIIFTQADLDALVGVSALIDAGEIDEPLALAMTRALARTTDRLAVWQTQLVAESLMPDASSDELAAAPDAATAEEVARRITAVADQFEPLLTYAWRRHMYGALARMLGDVDPAAKGAGPIRAVGFADLVNFTAVVRRATERELAVMVQRFEHLVSDIVTAHGGRVIKTVGDEVLFVNVDPVAGTAIALDLIDALTEDAMLPQVRVGMAHGQVLSRLGDVFGTTVHRASRLTEIAPPGTVWVDEPMAAQLDIRSGFSVSPQRRRHLRGIGMVKPSAVTRSRGDRGNVASESWAGSEEAEAHLD